ncbi:MAG: glycosyltransferase family 2 protein [Deltaproteobacteria bacterium]|nr:glycosyltransferase family 2 protein [Deltaproteobacteria bacterium]
MKKAVEDTRVEQEPVSIVVPAYNEEKGIRPVLIEIDRVLKEAGVEAEILVVDDGSDDATADEAAKAAASVIVLRHRENLGYGAALKTGFRHARYDWVAIIDADGTYPAPDLIRILAQRPDNDMVVGARTGMNVHIPLIRRPAKWVLRRLANYLSKRTIPDLNSGLRTIRKALVERYMGLFPNGFSLTTTVTLALLVGGYQVQFVPIDYRRRTGRSKIRPIRDTLGFATLILRTVIFFNPLRVFIPLSLFFMLAGLLVGLLSWIYLPRVLDATTSMLVLTGVQMGAVGMLADLIARRNGSP